AFNNALHHPRIDHEGLKARELGGTPVGVNGAVAEAQQLIMTTGPASGDANNAAICSREGRIAIFKSIRISLVSGPGDLQKGE
ncbi:hypothetical protein ABTL95_20555, partial [Acinetobacter baumannii]